jgi:4-hydroxythreonine-4-phosphate dehydrogenase
MIYVSQGHENGIGLEVFFKSILCLNNKFISEIKLFGSLGSITKSLDSIFINYTTTSSSIIMGSLELNCFFINKTQGTESVESLLEILKVISPRDILLTLPSSKDQIIHDGHQFNGYTEFLRNYYKSNVTMNFLSTSDNVLLLTDHVAIQDVPQLLTVDNIVSSISCSIDDFPKPLKSVYISGLNPHAGEDGLISTDDKRLEEASEILKLKYKNIVFKGPLPSDTIHLHRNWLSDELVVYCYHDQGLNPFKLRNGLIGINLSLGLEFIRVSVDHGTAFNLSGKNAANYQGMLYLLSEIKNWQKKSPV